MYEAFVAAKMHFPVLMPVTVGCLRMQLSPVALQPHIDHHESDLPFPDSLSQQRDYCCRRSVAMLVAEHVAHQHRDFTAPRVH